MQVQTLTGGETQSDSQLPNHFFSGTCLCNDIQVKETVFELHRMMLPHKAQLETSPWAGLAELTNLEGAICVDACQSQAWSSSTLLDLLYDIDVLRQDGRLTEKN